MEDNIFLDQTEAFKTASLQFTNSRFENLPIAYYAGDLIEDKELNLANMININLDNLENELTETPNRIPINIKYTNIHLSQNEVDELQEYFKDCIERVNANREKIVQMYKKDISNIQLDFADTLRIFFITSRHTTVSYDISKELSEVFSTLGYETLISSEQNNMQSWGQDSNSGYFGWHLKNMLEFKPHICINIDYMHNDFLPSNMFNFVWFQNDENILKSNIKLKQRKNDFIFASTKSIIKLLFSKNKKIKVKKQLIYTENNLQKITSKTSCEYFANKILKIIKKKQK